MRRSALASWSAHFGSMVLTGLPLASTVVWWRTLPRSLEICERSSGGVGGSSVQPSPAKDERAATARSEVIGLRMESVDTPTAVPATSDMVLPDLAATGLSVRRASPRGYWRMQRCDRRVGVNASYARRRKHA